MSVVHGWPHARPHALSRCVFPGISGSRPLSPAGAWHTIRALPQAHPPREPNPRPRRQGLWGRAGLPHSREPALLTPHLRAQQPSPAPRSSSSAGTITCGEQTREQKRFCNEGKVVFLECSFDCVSGLKLKMPNDSAVPVAYTTGPGLRASSCPASTASPVPHHSHQLLGSQDGPGLCCPSASEYAAHSVPPLLSLRVRLDVDSCGKLKTWPRQPPSLVTS